MVFKNCLLFWKSCLVFVEPEMSLLNAIMLNGEGLIGIYVSDIFLESVLKSNTG